MFAALRAFSRLVLHRRRWLVVTGALAVVQAALLIPIGLLLQRAFDDAIPSADIDELVWIGVLLVALLLGSSAVGLWTRWIVLTATKEAVGRLRSSLLERLQLLPASWFDRQHADRVHSIVVQDSERIDIMANAVAGQALPAAIICAALGVALVTIDPLLFALLCVTWPAMVLTTRRLRPRIQERTRNWQESFDRFSARMHFAVRGRTLIASHAAEEMETREAEEEIRNLSASGTSMAWLQSLYGQAAGTVAAVSSVVVLVVGGAAVAEGHTSLGSLISFYALLGLLRTQATQLLAAAPQVIAGGESLARLEEILDSGDPPAYRGTGEIDFAGGIALRDVHFGYEESRPVLDGIDIEAGPGEWLAIVGPNGVGKSTVAALILGLYRPWSGSVLADGTPYDELDLTRLRRRMAVVAQDATLLEGTVAQNITFGLDGISEDEVREAARLGGCAAALEALPLGYQTPIGDEGALLSGGQRQSIALARGVLRRPALMILDEPTTSLDRQTVPSMLAALRRLPWNPTTLVISHDPEVIACADRVYEMTADGRPAAQPSPTL